MTPLDTSLSDTHLSKTTGPYTKTSSNMTLVSPQHIWWDESQFDLDLADDSIIGGSEERPSQKQRFKKKLLATIKPTQQHCNANQRAPCISASSSRSSLYSTNSLSTPSYNQITHSKLSTPFIHLKHLFQKH